MSQSSSPSVRVAELVLDAFSDDPEAEVVAEIDRGVHEPAPKSSIARLTPSSLSRAS